MYIRDSDIVSGICVNMQSVCVCGMLSSVFVVL